MVKTIWCQPWISCNNTTSTTGVDRKETYWGATNHETTRYVSSIGHPLTSDHELHYTITVWRLHLTLFTLSGCKYGNPCHFLFIWGMIFALNLRGQKYILLTLFSNKMIEVYLLTCYWNSQIDLDSMLTVFKQYKLKQVHYIT